MITSVRRDDILLRQREWKSSLGNELKYQLQGYFNNDKPEEVVSTECCPRYGVRVQSSETLMQAYFSYFAHSRKKELGEYLTSFPKMFNIYIIHFCRISLLCTFLSPSVGSSPAMKKRSSKFFQSLIEISPPFILSILKSLCPHASYRFLSH